MFWLLLKLYEPKLFSEGRERKSRGVCSQRNNNKHNSIFLSKTFERRVGTLLTLLSDAV